MSLEKRIERSKEVSSGDAIAGDMLFTILRNQIEIMKTLQEMERVLSRGLSGETGPG